MPRRFVRFAGRRGGVFKSLLRTGDFGAYQYWVGGDRTVPFGPLPIPTTTGFLLEPVTIVATGPGLNDWVVCYQANLTTAFGGGPNLAFADPTGIIRTRTIAPIAGDTPTLLSSSAGNFATHRLRAGVFPSATLKNAWTTVATQETTLVDSSQVQIENYILPDALATPMGSGQNNYLWQNAAIDPGLQYALHDFGSVQTLWVGTTPVTLPVPLSGFDPEYCALTGLTLHQITDGFDIPRIGDEADTPTGLRSINRWQFAEDGTYTPIAPIAGRYIAADAPEDYSRLDYSYYLAASE